MPTKTLWQCPTCKRKFAKRNQWHSCKPVAVEAHFTGKPARLKALFEELVAKLKQFGPVRIDAVKSSINLASTYHFGGVRVLQDSLHVGFVIARPLTHERIRRSQQLGPSTYGHAMHLTRKEDLDAELLAWLEEAYNRSTAE